MAILTAILNTIVILLSLFMICLVLIQRGKGGGLAGAFGGVGGSSAFGTKSGDVFTRVTIVAAIAWFILSLILVVLYNQPRASAFGAGPTTGASKEVTPKAGEKAKVPAGKNVPPAIPVPAGAAPAPAGAPAAAPPVNVPAIPDAVPAPKAK